MVNDVQCGERCVALEHLYHGFLLPVHRKKYEFAIFIFVPRTACPSKPVGLWENGKVAVERDYQSKEEAEAAFKSWERPGRCGGIKLLRYNALDESGTS